MTGSAASDSSSSPSSHSRTESANLHHLDSAAALHAAVAPRPPAGETIEHHTHRDGPGNVNVVAERVTMHREIVQRVHVILADVACLGEQLIAIATDLHHADVRMSADENRRTV